jgi:TfuA protein
VTASTLVFLGPTLPARLVRRHPTLRYLPPVRRGDLPALLDGSERPARIAIIDGEFGQSLSVSVTEIRDVLRAGVEVWGASSMGALRAAECSVLGMGGVGWVFEQYATGALEADDEVALLFDPDGYRPLTVPLVNVRWALRLAVPAGAVPAPDAPDLLAAARALHFEERTWPALCSLSDQRRLVNAARGLACFVGAHPTACDRKALDALLLLSILARRPQEVPYATA